MRQRSSNLAESHSRLIIGVRLADSPPTIKSSVAAGTAAQTSHDASPGADPLPVQPKMLLDNPNERVLLFGNCVVVLLLAKPLSVSGVTAIEYAFEDVVSRGGWISYFSLVIPEQLADDGVARDRLARTLQRYTDRISGAAVVCQDDGFRATSVRSIVTGVHWASRAKHEVRVFDAMEPALVWLKLQPHNEELDFLRLGELIRTLLVPRPPAHARGR